MTQPACAGDAPLSEEGTHHDSAAPRQLGHELSSDLGTVAAPEYVSSAVRADTAPNGSGSSGAPEISAEWDQFVGGPRDVNAERNRFMARTRRYLAQVALGGARRLATTRVAQNIAARRQNPTTFVTADVMHDYGVQRVAIGPVLMRQSKHRAE